MAGQKIPAALAQEIVRLRVAEGLRYAEIQAATGATPATVSRVCSSTGCGAEFEAEPCTTERERQKLRWLRMAARAGTAEAWERARVACGQGERTKSKRKARKADAVGWGNP